MSAFTDLERFVVALAGVLNEKDDPRKALSWLLDGKLDAKNLTRVLEHTANDLRIGTADSLAFLEESVHSIIDRTFSLPVKNNNGPAPFEGTLVEWVASRLTTKTLPELWCRNEKQKVWLAQTHKAFSGELIAKLEQRGLEGATVLFHLADVARSLQNTLCQMCQNWAPRVDEVLFKGQGGAFLFFCRNTNALSEADFEDMIRVIMKAALDDRNFTQVERLFLRKNLLSEAMHVVATGAREMLTTCWECNTHPPSDGALACCPYCKVALYCSRKCQISAWKGGHKQRCDDLKKQTELFKGSTATVEHAHATGGMLEGEKLSFSMDYFAVSFLVQVPYPYPTLTDSNGTAPLPHILGPSMIYFYENYGRVLHGEWWFYSKTESIEQYSATLNCGEATDFQDVDLDYFWSLFSCLCYDIFGFLDERDSFHAELLEMLVEGGALRVSKATVGLAMPVERFRYIYQHTTSVEGIANESDRRRKKSNKRAEGMKFLRDNFHK